MKRYWGGQKVKPGTYVNLAEFSFQSVQPEQALPGTEMDEYRRVPTLALVVVGPLLGGLYVVFLPVIGFAMLAWVVGGKAVQLAGRGVAASVHVLKPAWQPTRAFLGGGNKAGKVAEPKDAWAEQTEKELEPKHDDPA